MTTSSVISPLSNPVPDSVQKIVPTPPRRRRILLVDACTEKRDLRSDAMRRLGIDVDCASGISEARSWWRPDLYHLVLMNVENDHGHRDKFCEDMRGATPPQQVAFLVGKPAYVADLPPADGVISRLPAEARTTVVSRVADDCDLPWGIMAASRRISAIRSVFAARSTAMRNRPVPARDLEVRGSRNAHTGYQSLLDLIKEDIS